MKWRACADWRGLSVIAENKKSVPIELVQKIVKFNALTCGCAVK
jgi:hypothetical protein